MREREAEAGINPPAIHQNGARAALAVIATFFRTGEMQMLAQRVEQRHARIEFERVILAVDFEMNVEQMLLHAA